MGRLKTGSNTPNFALFATGLFTDTDYRHSYALKCHAKVSSR
jgi:hypothetical protein